MNVLTSIMNWDSVALMSILMVIISVVIVVFLFIKVRELMRQDAEAHKKENP